MRTAMVRRWRACPAGCRGDPQVARPRLAWASTATGVMRERGDDMTTDDPDRRGGPGEDGDGAAAPPGLLALGGGGRSKNETLKAASHLPRGQIAPEACHASAPCIDPP